MKKITIITLFMTVFAFLILTNSIFAAEPPTLINYQGILRDSSDKPLNGDYDMIFTFFSASIAGDEILVDQHLASGTGAVTVTDGLFTAWLGGGQIFDGSGPGTYTHLPNVFSDYTDVFLEIEIYNPDTSLWELLDPRIRIISAAYSLNADNLDGYNSSYFLDTSSTTQTKSGKAIFSASSGNYGVEGYGPTAGGYFKDSTQTGYSYIGYGDYGIRAYGNTMGGYFKDLDGSGYTHVADGHFGIRAYGNTSGGYFEDLDGSGYAYVSYGDYGIYARGNEMGGYFSDIGQSGLAYVGYGNIGVSADGSYAGGHFTDSNSSGYAYVGYGDYGIDARGNEMGGYFEDRDHNNYAHIATQFYGVEAYGSYAGGYFEDFDSSGYARVGYSDYGIAAYGNTLGGYFQDLTLGELGRAYVGYGNRGIWAKGNFAGGTFSHPDDTTFWADVSTPTRKIYGTGSVSFVQNHPYDKSKVITYAAPEGDEVAVYTRGTAQLINGEALVKLGETFQWVANPDIGLTAHITPRGEKALLSVDSLKTSEMTVSGPEGSNAIFDYIVFGLRIGFEEIAVIQEKDREAFLPASEAVQEPYTQNAELRSFNAFERFKRMRQAVGETGEIDLTRTQALANAIDENKQEILEKARVRMEMENEKLDKRTEQNKELIPEALEGVQKPHPPSHEPIDKQEGIVSVTIPVDEEGNIHAKSFRSVSPDLTGNVPISEQVEVGDVLVVDPMNPGMMRLGDKAADAAVIGIVAGEPGVVLGSMKQIEEAKPESEQQLDEESPIPKEVELPQTHAPVALSGIVVCKVDADYGSIQVGDLLTTSTTKGHAMRSDDYAAGTIIGKALEPLDAGTGLIKVLVMMR